MSSKRESGEMYRIHSACAADVSSSSLRSRPTRFQVPSCAMVI